MVPSGSAIPVSVLVATGVAVSAATVAAGAVGWGDGEAPAGCCLPAR
jgi:hypothetical protein